MELQTSRLILRPFNSHDLDRMAELFANNDFMRFSLGPFSREQAAALLEKVMSRERVGLPSLFALLDRQTKTLFGYCGFLHHEVDGAMEIEIGYRLHPDFWNRGYATEAARSVRDHALRDWKLEHVVSLIHPDNQPSQRVAEKNGMRVRNETTFKGFPTLVFQITRLEWLKLQHVAG